MDLYPHYLSKALRFLSMRSRSEKEVREYLGKGRAHSASSGRGSRKKVEEVDQEVIERVIGKLKEQKFLDDEKFAFWWVEQRTRVKPKGKAFIRLELRAKGISTELIEKALGDEALQQVGDEALRKLVRRQLERHGDIDKRVLYQKIGMFLMRRGYDYSTSKKVIDEVLLKEV